MKEIIQLSSCFVVTILLMGIYCTSKTCIYIHYPTGIKSKDGRYSYGRSVCRAFKIGRIRIAPYQRAISEYFNNILNACCHKRQLLLGPYLKIWQMTPEKIVRHDFIYPVLGYTSLRKIYGHNFIPIYDLHGAFYITPKRPFQLTGLIRTCFELWPLLLMCVLMAVVSGFIAWLLETWVNKDEFPRSFLTGWLEGVWWSVVTMTTVGYGDKSPKGTATRVFAMVWMLVSIIAFGAFTSSLTTNIMEASTSKAPSIGNAKVGTLRNRIYDAYLVAQNGGIVEASENEYVLDRYGVFELVHKLMIGKIDGILLDKYTFWQMIDVFDAISKIETKFKRDHAYLVKRNNISVPKNYLKHILHFFRDDIVATEIPHTGEATSYGILVKNETDYTFFKDAIFDNKMVAQSSVSQHFTYVLRKQPSPPKVKIFDLFKNRALKITFGAVFGFIVAFGIVFQLVRMKRRSYAAKLSTDGDDNNQESSYTSELSRITLGRAGPEI